MGTNRLRDRTIQDFGEQWSTYPDNDGYYGSSALFEDAFGPLLELHELAGARVAEVGAGTGRFARIILGAGACHVIAIEPSDAFAVLQQNTVNQRDRITCLKMRGDQIPQSGDLDFVISYGVIHHIPEPLSVMVAARGALKPGGRFLMWVYGREGNAAYLLLAPALFSFTRRLPHKLLAALVNILYWPAALYMRCCTHFRLPLAGYMREVFSRLTPQKRKLVMYDQLNPAYARYYSGQEAHSLLEQAGFADIRLYHRHGYSWSVIGTKSHA